MDSILTLLIFFPLVAAMLGFLIEQEGIRAYGIAVTAIEFLLSLFLWMSFDGTNAGFQFL